jgi:hypothetical protein
MPGLLSGNPLPFVERAIPKLNAVRFTKTEEVNHGPTYKPHLFQADYCLLSAALDLYLQ